MVFDAEIGLIVRQKVKRTGSVCRSPDRGRTHGNRHLQGNHPVNSTPAGLIPDRRESREIGRIEAFQRRSLALGADIVIGEHRDDGCDIGFPGKAKRGLGQGGAPGLLAGGADWASSRVGKIADPHADVGRGVWPVAPASRSCSWSWVCCSSPSSSAWVASISIRHRRFRDRASPRSMNASAWSWGSSADRQGVPGYLGKIMQGDLGKSALTGQPVLTDIRNVFPATLELATVATLLGTLLGVPAGALAAVYKGRMFDHVVRVLGLVGYSMPGSAGLVGFYAKLGWVGGPGRLDVFYDGLVDPVTGMLLVELLLAGDTEVFWNAVSHLILPAGILGDSTAYQPDGGASCWGRSARNTSPPRG